jgi:hypothetical protein
MSQKIVNESGRRPVETLSVNGMTTPVGFEDAPLPKRNGHKGMLPSTWLGRELRMEYSDLTGKGVTTTGILLDFFPFGPVLNIGGARIAVSWEKVSLIELVSD